MNKQIEFYNKSFDEMMDLLSPSFPDLLLMKLTQQDNEWHSEGNVDIHTRMVFDNLKILFDRFDLSNSDKNILILSVLFHDIAKHKSASFKIEDRYMITHPGHEVKGANYICCKLLDFISVDEAMKVINLVRYHQLPKRMVIDYNNRSDEQNLRTFIRLNDNIDLNLIGILELADMMGRECNDKEYQIMYIEMFLLYANELKPKIEDFNNIISQYIINNCGTDTKHCESYVRNIMLNSELDVASAVCKYINCNDNKVIVLSGLPGSGKTYYAKSIYNDYTYISMDEVRECISNIDDQSDNNKIAKISHDLLIESLRKKHNIIFDATNLRTDFRNKILQICNKYNTLCGLTHVLSTKNRCISNMSNRERKVDEGVIDKMISNIQFPTLYEMNFITQYIEGYTK